MGQSTSKQRRGQYLLDSLGINVDTPDNMFDIDGNIHVRGYNEIFFGGAFQDYETSVGMVGQGVLGVSTMFSIGDVPHETTDVDKFLVSNNGLVKYRTGAEILSDIGGAPSSGSNSYIQNQSASAQSASMWISGLVKTNSSFFASFQDQYSVQEGILYPDKLTIFDSMMDTTVKVDAFGVSSTGMNGTLTLSGSNGVAISGLSASTSDSVLVESSGVIGKRNLSDMISGDLDSIYLRLDSTNDPITGALTINNSLTVDTDTLFVDSVNHRVGIGTTSSGAKLNIKTVDTTTVPFQVDALLAVNVTTSYKKPITIDNTLNPNVLTDYQVSVTVDTASLISAGKMRSDGGDIRFTDSDDSTQLSYWVESGINTSTTKIWIKVPSISASSTKTIYLHYGEASATSLSNGNDTFPWLFDDFNNYSIGDTPNTTDWETEGTGVDDTITVQADPADANKKVFRIKESGDYISTILWALFKGTRTGYESHFRIRGDASHPWYFAATEDGNATPIITITRDPNLGYYFKWYNGSAYIDFNPSQSGLNNTWYEIIEKVQVSDAYFHWVVNGVDSTGGFRSTPISGINKYEFMPFRKNAHNLYIGGLGQDNRYIFVGNFTNPNPTTSIGTEETITGGGTEQHTVFYIQPQTGNVGIGSSTFSERLNVEGSIALNETKIMTLPDQGLAPGSLIYGTGGESLDAATNEAGGYNTLVGIGAGHSLTLAEDTTNIGYNAGYSNTTGSGVVALGSNAGYNAAGSYWTAIGYKSAEAISGAAQFTSIGALSGQFNQEGTGWIAIGVEAAKSLPDGSAATSFNLSTYVGDDVRVSANGVENENVFGTGAIGSGSNTVTLGNSSIVNTYINGVLTANNGFETPVNVVTSNITLTDAYHTIIIDSDLANITITLPKALLYPGIIYVIKTINSGRVHTVQVAGGVSNDIFTDSSVTAINLTSSGETIFLQSDGGSRYYAWGSSKF